MMKRPVHWYEGMFLKPHHFQAADRYLGARVREAEDWFHPHNWGLRSVSFDEDAIANYSVVLRSCQARFKDGTTITVPEEVTVDPIELRTALANASETTVFLAVPTWQAGRANVKLDASSSANDPRYSVSTIESADENTGSDEEPLQYRNVQARLLLSNLDPAGYEVLPIARIRRAATAGAPPEIDRSYVPPVLGLDVWSSLQQDVRSLHEYIGAWINTESSMLVGRKVAFDSQILGDAERILKLSDLNAAYSALQAVVATRGLHPLTMYQELCRLLGQLAIFGDRRKPIPVQGYDHDEIGPIYAEVIEEIRRLIGGPQKSPFEKRYFQLEGRSFQVRLDPDWVLDTAKPYIGVETTELNDAECDELMKSTDWKLGSGEEVESIFQRAARGLGMKPLGRIPPQLPGGVVYFEIERDPVYWKDVCRTYTLGLRFKLERGRFLSPKILALTTPRTGRTVNLQLAVYVVKPG